MIRSAVTTPIRKVTSAGRIFSERFRAQRLRLLFPGVFIHRKARLGRGSRVFVSPGGRLVLGAGTIAENVSIQVGPKGHVRLTGRFIGPNSMIVGREAITVQPGAMIAEMCVLRDSDHDREPDGSISDHVFTSKPVMVGRDAWLASHVTVLKGVLIADRATVGAGAVVTHSVPEGSTVVGVPARPLRYQPEEHP